MQVGSLISVRGKSLKGKNRVSEHGSVWKIRKVWGTHILVESTNGKEYLRWIDGPEDKDFAITGEVNTTKEGTIT